ncbi:MAG: FecR domain-containing protein [Cyclobacteriaceae bacterium]
MNFKGDDTFLARWLNNSLTEKELSDFESSKEYEDYQKIVEASGQIIPDDYKTDEVFENVRASKRVDTDNTDTGNVRQMKYWRYGIAASVALIVFFLFNIDSDKTITTDFGETQLVSLPDNSRMQLNARSEGTYDENSWIDERTISLQGEAFFDVKRGSQFTVKTKNGQVTVLGTQFNVQSMQDLLIVSCYSGKVRVTSENEEFVLTGGSSVKIVGNEGILLNVNENQPGWISKKSTFKSIPAKYVLQALENQFNIEFKTDDINVDQTYTGSFPHEDLSVALDIVLGALQIEYEITNDKTVVLKK